MQSLRGWGPWLRSRHASAVALQPECTAFTDHPEPHRRRHLLRLWLCPPDGRELPPAYAQRWSSIAAGNRGGIRVAGAQPLEP